MASIMWLVVSAIMIVIEIATLGLSTIWFAGGALVSAVVAYYGLNVILQIIVFAVVSLILLLFTRPIAMKHLMKEHEKTNIDANIGKKITVKETIDNEQSKGIVLLGGLEWSAKSESNEIIEAGSTAVVKSISGNKLIVEKIVKEEK